jgi:hypothetical protein
LIEFVREESGLRPFGSFKDHQYLKHLTVDMQLITPRRSNNDYQGYDSPLHFLNPQELLPSSLETLYLTDDDIHHLTDVDIHHLTGVCNEYVHIAGNYGDVF